MRKIKHSFWSLFFAYLFFIYGCASQSPKALEKPFVPIFLNVVSFEIVNDYIPHGEEPYVDHEMSPHPVIPLQNWLEATIKPCGREGSAVIRIQEASMRWQKRPGTLKDKGFWPYRGIMRLRVELFDKQGHSLGARNIETTRVREVNENFFGGNKHEMWRAMMQELQTTLEYNLRQIFPTLLKSLQKSKQVETKTSVETLTLSKKVLRQPKLPPLPKALPQAKEEAQTKSVDKKKKLFDKKKSGQKKSDRKKRKKKKKRKAKDQETEVIKKDDDSPQERTPDTRKSKRRKNKKSSQKS